MLALSNFWTNIALYRKSLSLTQQSLCQGLWVLAAFSFLTTLTLPYIGEEAVYTLTSQEMYFYNSWIKPLIYGTDYGRPPLYNWLILIVTECIGLENVLLAARFVSMMMTLLSSVLLYKLVFTLTQQSRLSVLSACVFLSGDLLFRRGWLAYSDPTFAFFSFGACACCWIFLHKQRCRYLFFAFVCANAAFLTKAITGYVFLFGTLVVLLCHKPYRDFFFKKKVFYLFIFLQTISLLLPVSWHVFFSQSANGTGVIKDIQNQLLLSDTLLPYLKKLIVFPCEVWLRFFPTSLILAVFLFIKWRQKTACCGFTKTLKAMMQEERLFYLSVGIVLVNILPYWLAPQVRIRYILPLYPFIASILAYLVLACDKKCVDWVIKGLCCTVILRYIVGFWWFPYYEQRYRGDNQAIAEKIVALAQEKPIYTDDGGSIGLSVAAYVNTLRFSQGAAPVQFADPVLPLGILFSDKPIHTNALPVNIHQSGRTSVYVFLQKKQG